MCACALAVRWVMPSQLIKMSFERHYQFTRGPRRQVYSVPGSIVHPITSFNRDPYGNRYKKAIQYYHDSYYTGRHNPNFAYTMAKQVHDYASRKAVVALQSNWRRRKSNKVNRLDSKYLRRLKWYENQYNLGKISHDVAFRAGSKMRDNVMSKMGKFAAIWRGYKARKNYKSMLSNLKNSSKHPGFTRLAAELRRKKTNRLLRKKFRMNSKNPYYKGKFNKKSYVYNYWKAHTHGPAYYRTKYIPILRSRGLVPRRLRRPVLRRNR